MRIISFLAMLFLGAAALAQIPPLVMPQGVGVNIHFTTGHERDLDMIRDGGFKFVRMDFSWEATEKSPGKYDFSEYDELMRHLKERGIRTMFILDYSHPAYEKDGASPRHAESVAAFAKWSAAAAKHFANDHVIWEIFNEPNGGFWHPKPDAHEYTPLALATAKAIREAEPNATIVAPALSEMDWDFLKVFLSSAILQYLDGVTVHPYRDGSQAPETAAPDYAKLRAWIDREAPPEKKGRIPIISGEWGYSSNTKGVSLEQQAQYAVRQQLFNFANGIPLSIWYDWKNDGPDPNDNESNFGTVTENLEPKPAYLAIQKMTHELDGYEFQYSRRSYTNDFIYEFRDAVYVYSKPRASKTIAWTIVAAHTTTIEGGFEEPSRVITIENAPIYLPSP